MKRALVMSGGSSKGAYAVGCLGHLIMDLNHKYQIVCGISVGAINASFLSMFKDEKEGYPYLLNFWKNIKKSQVYKNWFPFGRINALWKKSLYNSQPLIDLIHSNIKLDKIRESGKNISVGAVSLTSGKYRLFTEQDDCFVDGVLASASFPVALNPIEISGELYSDGGIQHIAPLKAAIDLGADEIDVIICSPEKTTTQYDNNSKTLTLALRSVDLMTDQIINADVQMANMYNELVLSGAYTDKRYVNIHMLRPDYDLTEDSLNFNNTEINIMIEIGYQDAINKYK